MVPEHLCGSYELKQERVDARVRREQVGDSGKKSLRRIAITTQQFAILARAKVLVVAEALGGREPRYRSRPQAHPPKPEQETHDKDCGY